MPSTDQSKSAGKSGRRKGKGERGKKTVSQEGTAQSLPESPAPVQLQSPDQKHELQQPQPDHAESQQVELQPAAEAPVDAVAPAPEPQPAAAPSPAAAALAEPATAEPAPVSLQTIANAYRDYTRKSFEEFGSFVEQLSGARSLDKAVTVQTEFVKRAYETSVAESQKICELHNKLARQTFQPFQGLVGKARETHGKS